MFDTPNLTALRIGTKEWSHKPEEAFRRRLNERIARLAVEEDSDGLYRKGEDNVETANRQ